MKRTHTKGNLAKISKGKKKENHWLIGWFGTFMYTVLKDAAYEASITRKKKSNDYNTIVEKINWNASNELCYSSIMLYNL